MQKSQHEGGGQARDTLIQVNYCNQMSACLEKTNYRDKILIVNALTLHSTCYLTVQLVIPVCAMRSLETTSKEQTAPDAVPAEIRSSHLKPMGLKDGVQIPLPKLEVNVCYCSL